MEDSEYNEEEKEDSCECSENDDGNEQCDSDGIRTIVEKFSGTKDVAKQAKDDDPGQRTAS